MRITAKGQVTIAAKLRRRQGLRPEMKVVQKPWGKHGVIIEPAEDQGSRGRDVVEQMRGRGAIRMTTDEIMRLTRGDD
jgi:bifunctional DNA-binding transcriptional regulator/antitoxin component of YhaV-PrlF toxin-antitoxin module